MDYVPFLIFLLYLYMYLLCDNKRYWIELNWIELMKRWYFVLQTDGWTTRKHYSDDIFIISAMASQITSITIVYSTVYLFMHRSKKTSKLRVTGLCEGNSPLSSEFPAQSASTAENVSIWWRYHAMIMPQESKGRAIKMEWKKKFKRKFHFSPPYISCSVSSKWLSSSCLHTVQQLTFTHLRHLLITHHDDVVAMYCTPDNLPSLFFAMMNSDALQICNLR